MHFIVSLSHPQQILALSHFQGERGYRGPKGDKGPMGVAFKGPPGVKGQKGAKGEERNCSVTDKGYFEFNCTEVIYPVGFQSFWRTDLPYPMLMCRY